MPTVTLERISMWKARRSGGRITITGEDSTGKVVKIPNIDTIEVRGDQVIATDMHMEQYVLVGTR